MSKINFNYSLIIIQFLFQFHFFGQFNAIKCEWTLSGGGINDDKGNLSCIDKNGNIYSIGCFQSIGYGMGADPAQIYMNSSGATDVFIQKVDSLGTILWVYRIGSVYEDEGISITIDSLDNLYCSGYFTGFVDFNPKTGVYGLSSINNSKDAFILKLNSNCDFIWVQSFGSDNTDYASSIDINDNYEIVVSGKLNGETVIYKYDSSGNIIWNKTISGQIGGNWPFNNPLVGSDSQGNTYLTGHFTGIIDFNPGPSTNFLTSNGYSDIFILKLDIDGNFLWAKQIGSSGTDNLQSMSLSENAIHLTGFFGGTCDFNPEIDTFNLSPNGLTDLFVLKLDLNGAMNWVKQFGGSVDAFSFDDGRCISVDEYQNVYISGIFENIIDFDPSDDASFYLTSENNPNSFILKLSPEGNFISAKLIGGSGNSIPRSICIYGSSIILTGHYKNIVNFGDNHATNSINETYDIFTAKYSQLLEVNINLFGDTIFCSGDSVILNINNSDGLSYAWYKNNQNIIGISSNEITVYESGVYHAVVTTSFGNSLSSQNINVTKLEIPNADVALLGNSTFCQGDSIILNANNLVGATYFWQNNGTDITSGSQFSLNVLTEGSYSVTIIDSLNCSNVSETIEVFVNPLPTISAISNLEVCEGQSITLTASGGDSYSWNNGVSHETEFVPIASNLYTVTGTNLTTGCTNKDTVNVTVNALPDVTLSSFSSICDNAGVINLSGGNPTGGIFSGISVNNNSFNPSIGAGTFDITYTYTDNNSCSNSATQNLTVMVCAGAGLEDTTKNVDIQVYPNPTLNIVTIISNEYFTGEQYTLFDPAGRVILIDELNGSTNKIDVSKLSTGTYYLKIVGKNMLYKLTKE